MRRQRPRSGLEEGRLDLGTFTPGERYSAVLLLAFTAVLFGFGLPDGKLDALSGVGKIPSLAAEAGLTPTAGPAPSESTPAPAEPVLAAATPVATTEPAAPTPVGADDGATPNATPSSPPPTTTTTQPAPASPLPVPLPVPAPASPLRLEAPR